MIERTVDLKDIREDGVIRLPIGEDPGAPFALLSLRPRGSMQYFHGVSNPRRDEFFRSQGIDPARVLAVELVHSRTVLYPKDASELRNRQADGIIVESDSLVPTVTVADCMPIWIRHASSGAYGVLHSGWRGTGILESAVRGLSKRYGASPSEIDVVLGPSIGPCCYRVPRERAEVFIDRFGPEAAVFLDGAWRLDLPAANIALARTLGLRSLTRVRGCTFCDEDLGSYRREGPERFTRMVAAAFCGKRDREAA